MKNLVFLVLMCCLSNSAFGQNYYKISEAKEAPRIFNTIITEDNYQVLTDLGIEISAALIRPNSFDENGSFKPGSVHVKIRNSRGARAVSRINLKIRENDSIPLFDPKGTGEVDNLEFVVSLQNNDASKLKFSVYQTKDIKGGEYVIALSDVIDLAGDLKLIEMAKEARAK